MIKSRGLMKGLFIAQQVIDMELNTLNKHPLITAVENAHNKIKLDAMQDTPASVFCKDKPKLDKRRFKRWQKNRLKGGTVVRINQ